MKSHGPYAMKFFFCEFLCLVNVIGQMYFTDRLAIGTHLESIVIISIIKVPWLHLHDIWL